MFSVYFIVNTLQCHTDKCVKKNIYFVHASSMEVLSLIRRRNHKLNIYLYGHRKFDKHIIHDPFQ